MDKAEYNHSCLKAGRLQTQQELRLQVKSEDRKMLMSQGLAWWSSGCLWASNTGDEHSIPDQGTMIPHIAWHAQKIKKNDNKADVPT